MAPADDGIKPAAGYAGRTWAQKQPQWLPELPRD
jgi:hypothetical protein